jgi:hypothetical protein
MMAEVTVDGGKVTGAGFRFVRHNAANATVFCAPDAEGATLGRIADRAKGYGTTVEVEGDTVLLRL